MAPNAYIYPPNFPLQYPQIVDLSTPEGDPNSMFVAARNYSNGWMEVDYDDDVATDTSDPADGIRFELGYARSLKGILITAPDPGDVWVTLETDALLPTACYIHQSMGTVTGFASGTHFGLGMDSNGSGHRINRSEDGAIVGSSSYAATGRACIHGTLIHTTAATKRAEICQLFASISSTTVLEDIGDVAAEAWSGAGGVQITVGHSGTSGGGTQTARFRVGVWAATVATRMGG